MKTITRESVAQLAYQVKDGDNEAFRELESIAKPLLISISNRFSSYHHRFEFEEFYAISLEAMYKACMEYNGLNPSFLDYAKKFMLNRCYREVEHWNQGVRNIFENDEVGVEELDRESYQDDMFEQLCKSEFRKQVIEIIDENFDSRKAKILKMHIIEDKRISTIATELNVDYKNAYSVIRRGTKKIIEKYTERHVYP